jgi:outer membrane immunogenic protein
MRGLLLTSAALAVVIQVQPAAAQDQTWTGPYVGGSLGYGGQPNDEDETILFDRDLNGSFGDTVTTSSGANAFQRGFCGGAAESVSVDNCSDDDGISYGIQAGYDYQFGGSFVVGGLVEYTRSDVEDSVTAFSSTPALYTFTRRLRNSASIRARAGAGFGNALVYGTGGVAFGDVDKSFSTTNAVNTFDRSGAAEGLFGYRVGGGVEYRLTPSATIGAQYLYTSLGDDSFAVRAGGANVPVSNPFILGNPNGTDFRRSGDRFNMHNVSFVANFRF